MKRKPSPAAAILVMLLSSALLLATIASGQERQRRVDDPEDQEDLNRELWEFARNSPYESILSYVVEAQRQSKTRAIAEVELPDGWRILGDRMAAPMFGVFTDKPDYRPFVPARISEQLSEADRQRYQQLER